MYQTEEPIKILFRPGLKLCMPTRMCGRCEYADNSEVGVGGAGLPSTPVFVPTHPKPE